MSKKNLFALMLALVLMVMCALPVMASPDAPAPDGGAVQSENITTEAPEPAEAPNAPDEELDPDAPVVISQSEVESPVVLEGSEAEASYDEIAPEEQQQPVKKRNNTAYFVGAAIAVLVFIGVAFYCRANGNK